MIESHWRWSYLAAFPAAELFHLGHAWIFAAAAVLAVGIVTLVFEERARDHGITAPRVCDPSEQNGSTDPAATDLQ